MSEHTPGPWRVDPDEQHATGGERIFKVCGAKPYGGLIADVNAWWVDTQSAEANASLIAAAPTLLSTLQWITQEMKRVGEIDVIEATRYLLKLQAAIALASPQESEAGK